MNKSLKDQLSEEILLNILDGHYGPNDLINEKDFIEKYSASKTTVREALVKLCSDGVLKNIPRCGYRIPIIHPDDIKKLILFRKVIEKAALELTFKTLTRDKIDILKRQTEYSVQNSKSTQVRLHWKWNCEFHSLLCSFAENPFFDNALQKSMVILSLAANQYYSNMWTNNKTTDATNHLSLIRALEEKDLEKAKTILDKDIEEYLKVMNY